MITLENAPIIIGLVLIALFALSFYLKKIRNRHYRNIKKAKKIAEKLNDPKSNYGPGQKLTYLKKIDPFVFEELLLNSFEKRGYKIKRNKRYTGDGGIDGTMFNANGDKIIVQAKRYQDHINPQHVTEFNHAIDKFKAVGGYFIHTGKTGKKSHQNTNGRVHIISGQKLIELISI